MNIVSILEGIEKLVVELVTWILLVPRTLLMILGHPRGVPDFVESELAKSKERFDGYISPVLLFLVCSAVMFFLIDLFISTEDGLVDGTSKFFETLKGERGTAVAMGFLLMPLFLGVLTHAKLETQFTGEWVRRVLYIQCCYCSPLTLSVFSFGLYVSARSVESSPVRFAADIGLVVLCTALLIWFIVVETQLFARQRGLSIRTAAAALGVAVIAVVYVGDFVISAVSSGWDGQRLFLEREYIRDYPLPSTGTFRIALTLDENIKNRVGSYRVSLSKSARWGVACATARSADTAIDTLGDTLVDGGQIAYGEAITGKLSEGQTVYFLFDGKEGERIHLEAEDLNIIDGRRPEGGWLYWWIDIQHAEIGSSILMDELSDEERENRAAIPYALVAIYVTLIGWALGKGIVVSVVGWRARLWLLGALVTLSASLFYGMNLDEIRDDQHIRHALSDKGMWQVEVKRRDSDADAQPYTLKLFREGRNVLEACSAPAQAEAGANVIADHVSYDAGTPSNVLTYGGVGEGQLSDAESHFWNFEGLKHDFVSIELSSGDQLELSLKKNDTE